MKSLIIKYSQTSFLAEWVSNRTNALVDSVERIKKTLYIFSNLTFYVIFLINVYHCCKKLKKSKSSSQAAK